MEARLLPSDRRSGCLTAVFVFALSLLAQVGWVGYRSTLLRSLTIDEVHVFQLGLLVALSAVVAAFLDPLAAAVLVVLEIAGVVGVFFGLTTTAYTIGVVAVGVLALVATLFWRRRTGLVLGASALVASGLGLLLL